MEQGGETFARPGRGQNIPQDVFHQQAVLGDAEAVIAAGLTIPAGNAG